MSRSVLVGGLDGWHCEDEVRCSRLPVVLGSAVKLDMVEVERLCTAECAASMADLRNVPGVVMGFPRRPDGWPLMVLVDFGDEARWHGPVTMLRSAYDDA